MSALRALVLTGLFVVGGFAGTGVAALLTGQDGTVELVAGEQLGDGSLGPNGGITVMIDVYNPGERSVVVEPVAIGGWDVVSDRADAVTVAGGAWTALLFEVIPECTGAAARTLELVADDEVRELDLTDDAVELLDSRRHRYCGGAGIDLAPAFEEGSWDGDTYVLDVRLPGHGRRGIGELTIDDVMAGVPYQVEAEELPVTLPVNGSVTLTTRWAFNCFPDAGGQSGETAPYDAMFLRTSNGVQIHADVATWLYPLWESGCLEPPDRP